MEKNLKLKAEIVKTGMTQYRVSQIAGIHETRLSQIINGRAKPTDLEKQAISQILNKEPEELFEG